MELSDELVSIVSAIAKEHTPSIGTVVLVGVRVRGHCMFFGFLAIGQGANQARLAGTNLTKGPNAGLGWR